MGKISNITNSCDPQAINSRVFVGNLNTFQITKEDVQSIFGRYGRIIGISMHKGYAFVQYMTEQDSRTATTGEDQRIYANQPIDVNMANEPKPNRPSRKRPQGAGVEWDYYYGPPNRAPMPPLPGIPPMKRPRPDMGPPPPGPLMNRTLVPLQGSPPNRPGPGPPPCVLAGMHQRRKSSQPSKIQPVIKYDVPDILICGNCKQIFPDLDELTNHKRTKCRMRFICKCTDDSTKQEKQNNGGEPMSFTCASCNTDFSSCWELCQHCQTDHQLAIYVESKPNHTGETSTSSMMQTDNGSTSTEPSNQEDDFCISESLDMNEHFESMDNGEKDNESGSEASAQSCSLPTECVENDKEAQAI